MSRDELKAKEWAAIAVQFHQKAAARGIKIPFPDLCVCRGGPHAIRIMPGKLVHPEPRHDEDADAYIQRCTEARLDRQRLVMSACPVISKKTRALRARAIGEAIGATDAR